MFHSISTVRSHLKLTSWSTFLGTFLGTVFLASSGAIALELPAQSLERSDRNPMNTGVEFTPPPDSRRPSSSVGGASRGSQCATGAALGVATPIAAAVVPADTVVPLAGESPQDAVGHGLTTLAHPVLWVLTFAPVDLSIYSFSEIL